MKTRIARVDPDEIVQLRKHRAEWEAEVQRAASVHDPRLPAFRKLLQDIDQMLAEAEAERKQLGD